MVLPLMCHANANLLCIVPMLPARSPHSSQEPCRGSTHAHVRTRAHTEIAPPVHEEDHEPGRGARGGRKGDGEDHAALADPRQCAVSKLHTGRGPTKNHATLPPPPPNKEKEENNKNSCCPFFVVPYKYGNAGSTSRRFNQLPLLAKQRCPHACISKLQARLAQATKGLLVRRLPKRALSWVPGQSTSLASLVPIRRSAPEKKEVAGVDGTRSP